MQLSRARATSISRNLIQTWVYTRHSSSFAQTAIILDSHDPEQGSRVFLMSSGLLSMVSGLPHFWSYHSSKNHILASRDQPSVVRSKLVAHSQRRSLEHTVRGTIVEYPSESVSCYCLASQIGKGWILLLQTSVCSSGDIVQLPACLLCQILFWGLSRDSKVPHCI